MQHHTNEEFLLAPLSCDIWDLGKEISLLQTRKNSIANIKNGDNVNEKQNYSLKIQNSHRCSFLKVYKNILVDSTTFNHVAVESTYYVDQYS